MDTKEIFRALQAGELSLEAARSALLGVKKRSSAPVSISGASEMAGQPPLPENRQGEKPPLSDRHYGLVLSTVHAVDEVSLQPWILPDPKSDEITIQVKASAINFADIMCVNGLYPTMPDYPFVPGFEVSGIVDRLGSRVSGLSVGDEVIAVTGRQMGGHADYVNASYTNVIQKPKDISHEDACSLPVVFATAFSAFEIGKLQCGEHVLIHTTTGGVGLAAMQLARLKGCTIYGSSSRPEKLNLLKKLGVPHTINYQTSEFDREIKRITHNRGVDVVLNTLPGEAIQKGLNCLGSLGRYLEVAVHALKAGPKLDFSKLVNNQSFHSIDLRRLGFENDRHLKEMLSRMVSYIQSEAIVPIVSRIYPIHQIKEALDFVGQGEHIGKVVISHTAHTMTDLSKTCLERMSEQKNRCEKKVRTAWSSPSPRIRPSGGERDEGIAVIGMAGRFPKSRTLAGFWENMASGRDCISEIPPARWSVDRYYDPDDKATGKTNSKWMGVLEDMDKFDPLFFNISPAEAELMDPQQRLFLESCWSCIEDAGLRLSSLSGSRCGVYAGCGVGDYGLLVNKTGLNAEGLMGASSSILSSRISYLLNLKGPCLAIDTACSSSLVAIAEACNGLILHNSDLALAGGVSVITGPAMHIMMSKTGMLSKDGRCFTFDNRANGFVPGEGVGVVLLKRFSDAVRDQDCIYGVIRGWGVNQDGKTNGITAPSVNSQILLEKEVYERFGINPETISYVEAHGTGTQLGDPIEVEALTESFRAYTSKKNYCALGSVKTNIGHLLAAAGISGVIKVLLAMQYRMMPPTIQYETQNEHISLKESPFYINTDLRPWKCAPEKPRRACVSAFGFSGTNAHLVIEEYKQPVSSIQYPVSSNQPHLIVLSARSEDRLKAYAKVMVDYLEGMDKEEIRNPPDKRRTSPKSHIRNIAYTLQVGRDAMDHRLAFLTDSREALLEALKGYSDGKSCAGVLTGYTRKNKDGATLFEADENAKALMQTWIRKKNLKPIAELWVKGFNFDWNRLYGDLKPRRIGLPAYPFDRKRYWVSESTHQKAPLDRHDVGSESSKKTDLLIHPPCLNEQSISQTDIELLREKILYQLKVLFGEVIKLGHGKFDASEPLESYGIDSIRITQLNQKLEDIFGELSKTLFFEYKTLGELSDYLISDHMLECMQWSELGDQMSSMPIGLRFAPDSTGEFPELIPLKEADSELSGDLPMHCRIRQASRYPSAGMNDREPVAIIGMSGRFPQAETLDEYWENLKTGKDCVTEVPEDRWSLAEFYDADPQAAVARGKSYCKCGGFINGFADFDPLFFNISPKEAINMDPQERLFLETCWQAFEDAGYTRDRLRIEYNGRVGVFAGITKTGFDLYGPDLWKQGEPVHPHTSFSSVANRISYLMNLQGPSMPIDTMCSSSLTAIHEACEHLLRGECEMAIAGGVNLYLHPRSFVELCAQQMLSLDGQCKSFGKGGDGFVPGEGVGAILLKRLSQATSDQDPIYAVIRGSGINHGGRTHGYTVPNPTAQGELIREAMDRADVDARVISYVEAHGTGTELGDPIEITGLTQAFTKDTRDKGFCAIGSVKSNIGHLEAAAGIAGIIKIVLQLKNRKFVPSLHAETLNPNIDFSKTPFFVQQELSEWKRPVVEQDGQPTEYPRIAGISSFGAGGANAHVVVEEYEEPEFRSQESGVRIQEPESRIETHIIVLSAKSKERLKAYAKVMVDYLENVSKKEIRTPQSTRQTADKSAIRNLAYTLQVGREAMEERLALIVGSVVELLEKLKGFLGDKNNIQNLFRGQVKRNKEALVVFAADEDMAKTIDAWIMKRKYGKLSEVWVRGLIFDWNRLYGDIKPRRISLPTYPFAREQYWIPSARGAGTGESTELIHPLLHQNTSDLSEQRYSSTFTGREFFLSDHVVNGQKVLPGVAYLEMARTAVDLAAGGTADSQFEEDYEAVAIRLKNVVWTRPITMGESPVHVHIGLFLEDSGEIGFEIYSESENADIDFVMHNQGKAIFEAAAEPAKMDLEALKAECNQRNFNSTQCYEIFRGMGMCYGPAHRGIDELYIGTDQVLAKLFLPSCVSNTQNQFVLHPSVMDSALQASIALTKVAESSATNDKDVLKPSLPFVLEQIDIQGKCTSQMWALIRYGADRKTTKEVQKLDIDLCDDRGKICVRMKGFSSRSLEARMLQYHEDNTNRGSTPEPAETLTIHPYWKEQPISEETDSPVYIHQLVMLCEVGEGTGQNIATQMKGINCLDLQPERKNTNNRNIADRFHTYSIRVFEEIRRILENKPKGNVLIQVVVPVLGEQQLFSGIAGMLKTARLENPKIIGQLIEVEPGENPQRITEQLKENGRCPIDIHIRYQSGNRWVADWRETDVSQKTADFPWKNGGTYLITGGAGGLGIIFATDIVEKTKDTTLILTGRSKLNEDIKARLKELSTSGVRIEYKRVDVSRERAVTGLIQGIRKDFGSLQGIIHSAGVIRDNYIIKKTKDELKDVFAPKVTGLFNLDQASKDLSLDFFILCSSLSGVMGNPGQADYAAANAFMDAYATYRNNLVKSKKRRGQTLSINWPLWKDGGMHVDEETEKMIRKRTGMISMKTSTGIRALYQTLESHRDQVMVVEGDKIKIRETLVLDAHRSEAVPPEGARSAPGIEENLQDKTKATLKQIVSELLRVKIEDIDVESELNEYGFDSITLTELAGRLNRKFRFELVPTIFFEYPTICRFANYLVEEHREAMASAFNVHGSVEIPVQTVEDRVGSRSFNKRRRSRFTQLMPSSTVKQVTTPEPLAIVGMSGRFPMAVDLNEFWNNLVDGKDCIEEIPRERWDWRAYYGDPKKEANKTNVKWGGFIDGIERFDPLFFGISPKEASFMDPQQRLLMIYIWKAIEDAGHTAQDLSGTNTAIFVGTANNGYSNLISKENRTIDGLFTTGTVPSVGPNRMSYFLNLHGPSEPIETACSSSLVAVHRAMEAIKNGTCDMAIAGGVNTIVVPDGHISFNKAGMLCEDGRCKTFSDKANGYVRGEGVGMIFLKRLKAAEEAGDHIYGIIRVTAENHGGRSNSLTAPNPKAQTELLKTAYTMAGIDPESIGYIEAHGTGTELGDPIEINGLKTAFGDLYRATGAGNVAEAHCGLGSVKTNIGHLELAAGIAGVIKVLLQLKNKTLVKSLHCDTVNPYIKLEGSPFYIVRETQGWKPLKGSEGNELPRRAGVSSFGFGGANAHVVIEEYVPNTEKFNPPAHRTDPVIFPLSAKDKDRLNVYVKNWLEYLKKNRHIDLERMAHTLQVGRDEMPCRLGIVAQNIEELILRLKQWSRREENSDSSFFYDLKDNKPVIRKDIGGIIKTKNYNMLAQSWVMGNSIPWGDMHHGRIFQKLSGLPAYPFKGRKCWIINKQDHSRDYPGSSHRKSHGENKAAEFYTFGAEAESSEFQEDYLSFAPFPEKVPGFSMSRVFLNPKDFPKEFDLVRSKQIEMRQVLFRDEDFRHINSVFDIGCGHGTDIIQIAKLYPHIQTHGYTITEAQAKLGSQRIAQLNLGSRTIVFHKDSAKDTFPGTYDLIIGIEVSFHIRNKDGLFENITSSLRQEGSVLLMDYIANLRGPIIDPNVEISIPTVQEWINIISKHKLYIDEIIDASEHIANFLHDPGLEDNIRNCPEVVQNTFRNYANQSIALGKGWISYCLIKLKKDKNSSESELQNYNKNKIARQVPYREALEDMLKRGHSQYPESKTYFEDHLSEDQFKSDKKNSCTNVQTREVEIEPPPIQDAAKIKHRLRSILDSILGLEADELEENTTFEELGIGSINAVELLESINTAFNLSLPTSILFECNVMASLADCIEDSLSEKLRPPGNKPIDSSPDILHEKHALTENAIKKTFGESGNQSIGSKKDDTKTGDDIAIIGLSCRCAGANGQNEFWDLVKTGKDCIREIKHKDWLYYIQSKILNKVPVRYGAINGIEYFDPLFFNVSPKEAESMDVTQRILLEECYKALEDSGYNPSLLRQQQVGTVIGSMGVNQSLQDLSHFSMLGSDTSILASRIAYFLDLKGPSLAINTACSSSLVAIDLACRQLKNREINLAMAGGITVYTHPASFVALNNAGMLSKTGECRPFDSRADGIVVGDGVGVVILKRLQEAIKDNDHIYGIIRGSGMNNDGQTSGITVPSYQAQSRLEETVYKKNEISVENIQYIETHGTGTKLGDPIEIHALSDAFKKFTTKKQFCGIGSLKANIGHTTAAAGVLSVIKVLLSLKHKQIPPSIKFNNYNEHIDFEDSPFYINTSLKEWPTNSMGSRLAAVSSFGFSGTNAHLVLEEYGEREFRSQESGVRIQESESGIATHIIVLSAKSEERLKAYAKVMIDYIAKMDQKEIVNPPDKRRTSPQSTRQMADKSAIRNIAYTLQVGRDAMDYRLAILADSKTAITEALKGYLESNPSARVFTGHAIKSRDGVVLFETDKDAKELVQTWIQKKNLNRIAELWVKGLNIDWYKLYGANKPHRISLPTYPFDKDSFRVSEITLPIEENINDGAGWKTSNAEDPLMLKTLWKRKEVDKNAVSPVYFQHLIMLCDIESDATLYKTIETRLDEFKTPCLILKPRSDSAVDLPIETRFQMHTTRLFEEIQRILRDKPKGDVLIQVMVSARGEQQLFSGLSGLLKTAQIENPRMMGQVIEVDPGQNPEEHMSKLKENSRSPDDDRIRYQNNKRSILGWSEIESATDAASKSNRKTEGIPWKDQGIYLITGGAGALGLIFSKEIAQSVIDTVLILTGRTPLDQTRQAKLKELRAMGARVEYRSVDVTQKNAVDDLFQTIEEKYGTLNGIIHSAGIIRDNYILKKSEVELHDVLAPKVTGLVNLDRASKDLPLDFFILFSSGAGVLGNPGQADYAAANSFMDVYARYRNTLIRSKQRHGNTLSINWPLWQEGGMQVDEGTKQAMQHATGMVPMQTEAGIQALYKGMASWQDQILVMTGDLLKLQYHLFGKKVRNPSHPSKTSIPQVNTDRLREQTIHRLKVLFGETIQLAPDRIDDEEPLERYGIDSIIVTQLNQQLEKIFGAISKTLFYEYHTLDDLAGYFIEDRRKECIQWTGQGVKTSNAQDLSSCRRQTSGRTFLKAPKRPASEMDAQEPIAIIGMSGRFPQAGTLDVFWKKLKAGEICISEIPEERWVIDEFFHPNPQDAVTQGKSYCKWGGFLEGFANFDPLFFNMSPRDAIHTDPQERLFLEECWRAFEDAGYVPSQLDSKLRDHIGVYGAITKMGVNTSFSSLVNRVSYFMNFRGPSVPVDTMCSSTLVALHQACENLRHRDIQIALVGAVNLYLHPNTYIALSRAQLISDSNFPAVFSRGGKGFVPSEGVGAVVLKRLADAEEDNDTILAVIRGSAVNHTGKSNGYSVPDPKQQAAVIERAIENSRVDRSSIGYIESGANGSEMGDAIEMTALTKIFQRYRGKGKNTYRIGSLKSTMGHGEAVSAMAQLLKVVLQLKNKMLCPTLVSDRRNPNIDFDALPFQIQTEIGQWPLLTLEGKTIPRRAGISSMGAGGVNAHMIVEEYDAFPDSPPHFRSASLPVVFVLSARTNQVFIDYLKIWRGYLEKHTEPDLSRITYSLQTGREAMKYRFACVVNSSQELIQCIDRAAANASHPNSYTGVLNQRKNSSEKINTIEDRQIEALIADRELNQLAQAWVLGTTIPWEQLYKGETPKPLTQLPTYPFVQKRYWPVPVNEEHPSTPSKESGNIVERNEPDVEIEPVMKRIRGVIDGMLVLDDDDEIDDGINFSEMGFSSITIVAFIEALNKEFNLNLRETSAFDYPTLYDLSAHVVSHWKEKEDADGNLKKVKGHTIDLDSLLLGVEQDDISIEEALKSIGL